MVPYIQLPGCPVAIWQNEFEITEFIKLLERRHIATVLDIGTHMGGTAWCWLAIMRRLGTLVTVDVEDGKCDRPLLQEFADQKGIEVHFMVSRSQEKGVILRVMQWFPEGIDLVWVDGGHSYGDVSEDYENYWPMVREGGIFAMHDIHDAQVGRVFQYIQDHEKFEGMTRIEAVTSEPHWLGIGVFFK